MVHGKPWTRIARVHWGYGYASKVDKKLKREDALQMAVASLLDASGLTWFHPANGEHRNPITGATLKRMGV